MLSDNGIDGQASPVPAGGILAPRLDASPGFAGWLGETGGSLAVSTLTSNVLLFLSAGPDGRLVAGTRDYGFCRGLAIDRSGMWVAGDKQLVRLANIGPRRVGEVEHDAVFLANRAHFVGRSLVHDIAMDVTLQGERHDMVFVNTSYSVLATVDPDASFRPLWKPSHVSALAAEDRCHLNCFGLEGDRLRWVSMFSGTDSPEGWREAPAEAGLVIDVESNEVVCRGLSKPHSLRWHQGRLWLLDSGSGTFGHVDFDTGRLVPVCRFDTFLRGLAMIGPYAVIGGSARRPSMKAGAAAIPGLVVGAPQKRISALYVVDLRSGAVAHALRAIGLQGLYDVVHLPTFTRPLVARFGDEGEANWTTTGSFWAAPAITQQTEPAR